MKQLFIMRHGEATFRAKSDFDRELTPNGRRQVTRSAEALKSQFSENGIDLNRAVLWVSPLVRAQQTAEIVAELTGITTLETVGFITPDDNPFNSLTQIHEQARHDVLVLITHMPFCASLAGILTDDPAGQAGFNTAECRKFTCSDYLPGCGSFSSVIE